MFCPVHTPAPTCWTKWSTLSSAGGGRSRSRGSLCLTAMLSSAKRLRQSWCRLEGKKTEKKPHCDKVLSLFCFLCFVCFFFNKFSMTKWRRYWERPCCLQAAKETREFVFAQMFKWKARHSSADLLETVQSLTLNWFSETNVHHRDWFGSKTVFSLQNTNTI